MLIIFQAKPQNLNKIYRIIQDFAKSENISDKIKATEAQLGELLFCDKPNHFIALAMLNERICGLVLYNYTNNNICANISSGIYIEILYVMPEFRSRGIGKSLLTYVADEADEANCSRIEWWVSKDNHAAANFYSNLGAVALSDWTVYKCDQVGIKNLLRLES